MKRHAKAALTATLLLALALLGFVPASLLTAPSASASAGVAYPSGLSFEFVLAGRLVENMAVGESADRVYVLNAPTNNSEGSSNVGMFDSASGNFVGSIDESDAPSVFQDGDNVKGIAVDNTGGASDGTVYISTLNPSSGSGGIYKFSAFGALLGEVSLTGPHASLGPDGLALDASGDLYVLFPGAPAYIDKFSPAGGYLAGIAVPEGLFYAGNLSVDPSGDKVYAPTSETKGQSRSVSAYSFPGGAETPLDQEGVKTAVDDDGNVYVAPARNTHRVISKYDSDGLLLGRFGRQRLTPTAARKLVAIDNDTGNVLYGWAAEPGQTNRVDVFGPAESVAVPDVSLDPPPPPGFFGTSLSFVVNPQGGPTVYEVEYSRAGLFEWSALPGEDAGSGTADMPLSVDLGGLAHGTSYDVRVVATNTEIDSSSFSATHSITTSTVPPPPIPVASVDGTGVGLTGSVHPHGVTATWHFEYASDGGEWVGLPSQTIVAGDSPVAVQAEIDDLAPNEAYEARLVVTYSDGGRGDTTSAAQQFITDPVPPAVITRFAAPRTQTAARLNGLVNPRNSETEYWFEYGETEAYGTRAPLAGNPSAGEGSTSVLVSQEIEGLKPDTTYHYRIVADNGAEVAPGDIAVEGESATFTTRSPFEAGPPNRGIELVNNPDKGNQDARAIALSPTADKVLWGVNGGAPGSPSGRLGTFVAERDTSVPTGWRSTSVLPPIDVLFGGGSLGLAPTFYAPDFSTFLFDATKEGVFGVAPHTVVQVDADGTQRNSVELATGNFHSKAIGVTRDLSHWFSATKQGLVAEHPTNTTQLYDLAASPPQLLSIMPGTNQPPPCGLPGVGPLSPHFRSVPYAANSTTGDQVSAFFHTAGSACLGPLNLYRRDLSKPAAEPISTPPLAGPDQGAALVRTDTTGTRALFVSATRLDPADANGGQDLYVWTEGSGNECLTCVVADARIESQAGRDVIATDDFSYVYFLSRQLLEPDLGLATPSGDSAHMYLLHDGEVRYVAPAWRFLSGGMSANGQTILFLGDTAGITTDVSQADAAQLYRFDSADGSVECVSCRHNGPTASGAPNDAYLNTFGAQAPDGYGTRSLSADGETVVFQTREALVAEDTNDASDVYEWRHGQPRLVTDGKADLGDLGMPVFQGLSDDASNVLFTIASNLTGRERDNMNQLYMARVDGGMPPPTPPPPPCNGDACQGPVGPIPTVPDPGSRTAKPAGNKSAPAMRPCARKKASRKQSKKRGASRKRPNRCGKAKGGRRADGKRKQARQRPAKGRQR